MSENTYRVLLIEDNPGDARLMKELLAQTGSTSFVLEWADWLSKGLERLRLGGIDAVLLDLSLPDSRGFDTFIKAHQEFPDVPIILMTGLDDEDLALRAVREGAQDYMVKGQVSGPALVRSMRYAIERHRQRQTVRPEVAEIPRKKARVLGFLGVKGGTGTTTFALNVASVLAQNHVTVAVELHPSAGSFAAQLRHAPAQNLSGLLNRDAAAISEPELSERIHRCPSGLRVLFGPQLPDEFNEIRADQAAAIISRLGGMAEYVVIDLPSQPSEASQAALRLCNYVTLVCEPDPVALAMGKATMATLVSWGIPMSLVGAAFNNRTPRVNAFRFNDIAVQLGLGVLCMVPPAADAMMLANESGSPLALSKPDSNAGSVLVDLASRLKTEPVELFKS